MPVEAAVAAIAPGKTAPDMAVAAEQVASAPAAPAPQVVPTAAARDEIVTEAPLTATAPVGIEAQPSATIGERATIAVALDPVVDEPAEVTADAGAVTVEVDDEAILELVAMEMSAPDPAEAKPYSGTRTSDFDADEPVAVDDDIVATFTELTEPEPSVATSPLSPLPPPAPPAPEPRLAVARASEAPPPPAAPVVQELLRPAAILHAVPKAVPEPSLGSTLIAHGLLHRHQVPVHDALTPIRRMTQPEKVAFFS